MCHLWPDCLAPRVRNRKSFLHHSKQRISPRIRTNMVASVPVGLMRSRIRPRGGPRCPLPAAAGADAGRRPELNLPGRGRQGGRGAVMAVRAKVRFRPHVQVSGAVPPLVEGFFPREQPSLGPGPRRDGGAGPRRRDLRGAGQPGRHRQDPAGGGLLPRAAGPPRGGGPGLGQRRQPGGRGDRLRPGGQPRRRGALGRKRGGGGRPLRGLAGPDPAVLGPGPGRPGRSRRPG